jgi:hypothetical protein
VGKKKKDFDLDRIDRLLAQFPDEDSPPQGQAQPEKAALPAGKPGKQPTSQRVSDTLRRHSPLIAWVSAVAGVVLAVAMTQWPYGHACGGGLGLYLLAVMAVVAVGIWAGIQTWKARLAIPHVLALGVFLWGVGLGLFQLLPRIGYASTEATWRCWGQPEAPATDVPAAAPAATPAPGPSAVAADSVEEDSSAGRDSAATDSSAMADSVAAADSLPAADSIQPGDTTAAGDSIPAGEGELRAGRGQRGAPG